MSEEREQVLFMMWASRQPFYRWLFHIPNGEQRSRVTGARLKAMGVKAGVPDLFLAIPTETHHGLWIEMKKEGGKVSAVQADFLNRLSAVGYSTVVAYSCEEAVKAVEEYLRA